MEIQARSQRYNQVIFSVFRLVGILLVWMTIIRYMHFFLARHAFGIVEGKVIFEAFLIGVRFDLLVWGFLLLPMVFILPIIFIFKPQFEKVAVVVARIYLSFCWILIMISSLLSLPHYLVYGRHFRWSDQSEWLIWPNLDTITNVILLLIFIFMTVAGVKSFIQKDFYEYRSLIWKGPKLEGAIRLLIPMVLVVLAARGTVTAHHLEKAHSEISPWEIVNELALNAVWCADK